MAILTFFETDRFLGELKEVNPFLNVELVCDVYTSDLQKHAESRSIPFIGSRGMIETISIGGKIVYNNTYTVSPGCRTIVESSRELDEYDTSKLREASFGAKYADVGIDLLNLKRKYMDMRVKEY